MLRRLLGELTTPAELQARQARKTHLAFDAVDARYAWITDAGKRVGLIDRQECTLEWIAPHPDQPSARPAEIPAVYHAPTYQGGRIIAQWWVIARGDARFLPGGPWRIPWDALPGRDSEPLRKHKPTCSWTFSAQAGETLAFRIDETFALPGSPRGSHQFTIRFDPLANSYLAEVDAELTLVGPHELEFCNLYAGGVYDNRPRSKRYQYTVWSQPDGRLLRWPHHPSSYMAPGMNDPEGERRIAEEGFIGYFTDPHSNPLVELVETTLPVAGATCCNIYDEHLAFVPPAGAQEPQHYRARFRFYSVTEAVARQIVARSELVRLGVDTSHPNPVMTDATASDPDLSRRLNYNPRYPVFRHGCVNSFAEAPPLDQTVAGSILFVSANPQHDIYWDPQCGHSGRRSIRVRGHGDGEVSGTRLAGGSSPHLDANRSYRLSGWIRCEAVTGGARIRFEEIGMRPRERTAPAHLAGPLSGTCDWTYVECRFTSLLTTQFGWLYLDVEGAGQAWFDDVALEEC